MTACASPTRPAWARLAAGRMALLVIAALWGPGTVTTVALDKKSFKGKTTRIIDDINEVTVQVVNLVTSHRAQMQPQG